VSESPARPSFRERVGATLKALEIELRALGHACRHPGVPRRAKIMAAVVIAYAVSPIDLIPDVIPFFGLLDDALLLPIGVAITLRMIPREVMEECRERVRSGRADAAPGRLGRWAAAGAVACLWIALAALPIAAYAAWA